jgi:vesicle-associated membrane protein 7
MAEDTFGRRVPFTFLEDIKREFEITYGDRAKTSLAYGMNEFSRVLAEKMVRKEMAVDIFFI